jgi:hypothetical protein
VITPITTTAMTEAMYWPLFSGTQSLKRIYSVTDWWKYIFIMGIFLEVDDDEEDDELVGQIELQSPVVSASRELHIVFQSEHPSMSMDMHNFEIVPKGSAQLDMEEHSLQPSIFISLHIDMMFSIVDIVLREFGNRGVWH